VDVAEAECGRVGRDQHEERCEFRHVLEPAERQRQVTSSPP
jgi:hypothetical protein